MAFKPFCNHVESKVTAMQISEKVASYKDSLKRGQDYKIKLN